MQTWLSNLDAGTYMWVRFVHMKSLATIWTTMFFKFWHQEPAYLGDPPQVNFGQVRLKLVFIIIFIHYF